MSSLTCMDISVVRNCLHIGHPFDLVRYEKLHNLPEILGTQLEKDIFLEGRSDLNS